ncbi:MAG: tetratricopeptide repeat protein [Sulfitobacter sp.]
MRLTFILAVLAAPAFAECPAPADTSAELLNLFAKANAAANANVGRRVSGEMWQLWLRAPDEAAQEVLDAGMGRRDAFDFAGAITEYDRLIAYCPDYAEGYNQRAYVRFLREDYETALGDLDTALDLQPHHVAAQSGRALTLMKLGRLAEARAQLLIAVENNPWLSEAALLADGAPLGRKDKDI